MGKTDSDDSRPRKRRLNVIFFVDAAKTRSFSMPLGRLNVLLVLAAGLLLWSVTSAVALVWLAKDRWAASERVRAALATIFEYETRYDHVYDVAYPSGNRSSKPTAAADDKAQDKADAPAATGPYGKSGPAGVATTLAAKSAPVTPPAPAQPPPAAAVAQQVASTAPDKASEAPQPEQAAAGEPPAVQIAVSNPVLEASPGALELRFDLTSKEGKLAEGYLWAVAEFKSDADGKTIYIGAPASIEPQANGEPAHPQRSAIFSIRRMKKKSFSFKLAKGQTGTFTSVKIGVMDKSGQKRTTYNVPVDIKIAQSG